MKIEEVKIDKIIPYEWNNKIHDDIQIDRIANSIKEFWFTQPIVIDKNNIIIVGHGRVEWAKKLWMTVVPCIRAENLTDEQIKKYRILDNKLNESEYNLANLKLELDSLPDLNFWELKISAFDMFPELDAPEFNPDDYGEEKEKKEKQPKENEITLSVQFNSFGEANIAKEELEGLWYTDLYVTL